MLVGFAPGSSTDVAMRLIGPRLGEILGQNVLVDNRAGAGGNIAAELTAKAPADGYTLLFANGGIAIAQSYYTKLEYSALKDLAPVALVTSMPHIVCSNLAFPAKTIKELVTLAKTRPGDIMFSSAGIGNSDHMAGELFGYMTGTKYTHVPNKGGPQALQQVVRELQRGTQTVVAGFAQQPVHVGLRRAQHLAQGVQAGLDVFVRQHGLVRRLAARGLADAAHPGQVEFARHGAQRLRALAPLRAEPLPVEQEPLVVRERGRLDLVAQALQRVAMDAREQSPLAPLLARRRGAAVVGGEDVGGRHNKARRVRGNGRLCYRPTQPRSRLVALA